MEIQLTTGMLLFYGGIAGCVISLLSMIIATKIFSRKSRKIIKSVESELD